MNNEYEIAFAVREDIDELTELWQSVFCDGREFARGLIESYLIPVYNVPVVKKNGEIVSALYLADFDLYSNRTQIGQCSYLFAAATKPEHRNKGLMSELIKSSAELYKNRGIKAIFLFPSESGLFEYYKKFGFVSVFGKSELTAEYDAGVSESDAELTELNLNDVPVFDDLYENYREFTIAQPLSPLKDRLTYYKFARAFLDETDGKTACFGIFENNVEKFCYVFYKKYINKIEINDIIPFAPYRTTDNSYRDICEKLAYSLRTKNDDFKITCMPRAGERTVPTAMILPLCGEIGKMTEKFDISLYISLFLDD